jgi:hypothetical protein
MTTWSFAQRVSNTEPILTWVAANIDKNHIVRIQHESIDMGPIHFGFDIRIVIDNRDSAIKLFHYMEDSVFQQYIVRDMRYFRVSWYPLRPSF